MGDAPYSRVSRDSINDEQLARLIRIVDLSERHASNHDVVRVPPEVRDHFRADAHALSELHALLIHERTERIIDDREQS